MILIWFRDFTNSFSLLCCPLCFEKSLGLTEDSTFSLCINFHLKRNNCEFVKGFCSTKKVRNINIINILIVFALYMIRKEFSSAKIWLFRICHSFRWLEAKLFIVVSKATQDSIWQKLQKKLEKTQMLLWTAVCQLMVLANNLDFLPWMAVLPLSPLIQERHWIY